MKRFVKIVNRFQPLNIFAESSILDVWQGSKEASEILEFYFSMYFKSL